MSAQQIAKEENTRLTKSQHVALRRWRAGPAAPRLNGTRTDVAERLVELGFLIMRHSDQRFNAGYADLKLTPLGADYLDWHP